MNDKVQKVLAGRPKGWSEEEYNLLLRIVAYHTRPWEFYEPHEKQFIFHQRTEFIRALIGGNRSGKTYCGAQEAVWHAIREHPYLPDLGKRCTRGRIAADKKAVTDDIIPLLKRLIPDNRRKTFKEGHDYESRWDILSEDGKAIICTFDVMTYDQDPKLFESVSLDWVWFDEPPSMAIWNATMWRLPERVWLTFTPLRAAVWYVRNVKRKPQNELSHFEIRVSIHDNPHISEDQKKRALATMDPMERDARESGLFMRLIGTIYPQFDESVHVLKAEIDYEELIEKGKDPPRIKCAIDPHDRKPPFVTWTVVHPDGVSGTVIDCLPETDWADIYNYAGGPERTVREIREREIKYGYRNVEYWMDPRFGASPKVGTGRKVLSLFNSAARKLEYDDMRFRLARRVGLEDLHATVRDFLQFGNYATPRLFVSPRAHNVISAFGFYVFKENRNPEAPLSEKIDPTWKDPMDCIGYTVLTFPTCVGASRFSTYADTDSESHRRKGDYGNPVTADKTGTPFDGIEGW